MLQEAESCFNKRTDLFKEVSAYISATPTPKPPASRSSPLPTDPKGGKGGARRERATLAGSLCSPPFPSPPPPPPPQFKEMLHTRSDNGVIQPDLAFFSQPLSEIDYTQVSCQPKITI